MVPGEGPQPAAGMIVGEAPGKQEVEAGRPFIGKAGKLLDSALRALGLDRAELYVTNVVKDLPLDSDNKIRRPFPEEIAAWAPILAGEIENTAPAALLALGRTATDALTDLPGDKVGFGSKIGNVYTAWHPSYLLHRGRDEGQMEEWLEQLRPFAEALGKFEYPS